MFNLFELRHASPKFGTERIKKLVRFVPCPSRIQIETRLVDDLPCFSHVCLICPPIVPPFLHQNLGRSGAAPREGPSSHLSRRQAKTMGEMM